MTRLLLAGILLFGLAGSAMAIEVTGNMDATQLANALINPGTGLIVTGATLSGNTNVGGAMSAGTYTNNSHIYGNVGAGIVITSGNALQMGDGATVHNITTADYGTTETAAQKALLDPVTPGVINGHHDVTELDITFSMDATHDTVFFDTVFASAEYPDFVNSFNDGFGLYVNGTNIAFVDGLPVNINHPSMTTSIPGTVLGGVLDGPGGVVHTFSQVVGANTVNNHLIFIIADTNDTVLDTTAYIAALGGEAPPDPTVPEPLTMLGMALSMGGVVGYMRKRKLAA